MNRFVEYLIFQEVDLNKNKHTTISFSFMLPNGNYIGDRFSRFSVSSEDEVQKMLDFYGLPFNGKKIEVYDINSKNSIYITFDKLF